MAKVFDMENLISNTISMPKEHIGEMNSYIDSISDIKKIPIDKLDIIKNQPFKKYNDEALIELREDINENGLYSPLVVNKNVDRYTILSGRNRYLACQELGWDSIPCKVLEVNEAKANLILVNANLNQRQELLPSEKALAYRLQRDSIAKIKGISFTKAVEELAEQESVTKRNIYRYIKLSDLSPALLKHVDNGNITLKAGILLVDFSFQECLSSYLDNFNKKINEATAASLLELQQHEEITENVLDSFFNFKPEKERKNIKIDYTRINSVIEDSNSMSDDELEDYIINAIDFYKQNHKDDE